MRKPLRRSSRRSERSKQRWCGVTAGRERGLLLWCFLWPPAVLGSTCRAVHWHAQLTLSKQVGLSLPPRLTCG